MNISTDIKMRVLFAVLCIVAGISLGILWHFVAFNVYGDDDMHLLDVSYYWKLYLAIGGVSGGLAWYSALMVEKHHVRPFSLAAMLIIPLMFLFVLAIDKNPITAFAIIVLFGFGMIPTLLVMKKRQTP